ncbi:MAG: Tol biopolymer transport system component [Verrucomicrobiales bacterium]|jgi:Tol biopolymer transport system component
MSSRWFTILPVAFVFTVTLFLAWGQVPEQEEAEATLLTNTRQVTFAGKRAGEGYFNADGTKLAFQSERDAENPFFQIYVMDLETGDVEKVSPGHGKTTCSWLHPGGEKLLYASTHDDPEAKAKQAEELEIRKSGKERRYSWDYDLHYDIYESALDGSGLTNLTNTQGYDAEGSYSPDGVWIAFASNRHAYTESLDEKSKARFEIDKSYLMEIYRMRADGSEVQRLTKVNGYDGGPFFNSDGTKICWRRFNEGGDQAEIWVMDADGSNKKQLTNLGAMSWAPFFHPTGDYLIFATNLHGFGNFELYLVDAAGTKKPVRVTHTEGFDGLPAFSPDGKMLSWTSNRTPNKTSQLFFADWNHEAALEMLNSGQTADFSDTTAPITVEDLTKHVTYLASEELEGRLTGTEGAKLATAYVAEAFAHLDLEPSGDQGSYFQEFDFTAGVDLGKNNQLTLTQKDDSTSYAAEKDWLPLTFSQTGDIEAAEIVFAGYGIEAPAETGENGEKFDEYSSYFHLDVKDKWVLAFRYAPHKVEDAQRQRLARYSSLRFKAMLARQKGARGLLVVSGPNSKVKRELVRLTFDASLAGSGVAAMSISDALAQKLLDAAGKDLKTLQDQLDTGEMSEGIPLEGLKLRATIDINEEKRRGRNVIAMLPGDSPNPHEPMIVIGAHVDHLGRTAGANSRAKEGEENAIHYGADDNASGTAGMLEIAQWITALKANGKLNQKRSILFAAWSGEELGLLGSAHFTRSWAKMFGDEDAKLGGLFAACLNMDMIGRLRKSLILQGVASSDRWPLEIEQRNIPIGLPIVTQNDTYIPTDATSFYVREVPILSAFTGAHDEYHTPRDTVNLINFEGAQKISKFMGLVLRSLVTSEDPPAYNEVARPENEENRGGLRVYLGTIPDYAQGDIEGVKLSGVRKGAPAAEAGMESGDIIIKLGGKQIKNIYDYTYTLGALSIGEKTEIVVKRSGEEKTFTIVPSSRD